MEGERKLETFPRDSLTQMRAFIRTPHLKKEIHKCKKRRRMEICSTYGDDRT